MSDPATVAPLGTPLTERELEVLIAYCEAEGEKGAAVRLGIKPSTVKHHLAHARSRLGVTTTAAAVYAVRHRLP